MPFDNISAKELGVDLQSTPLGRGLVFRAYLNEKYFDLPYYPRIIMCQDCKALNFVRLYCKSRT